MGHAESTNLAEARQADANSASMARDYVSRLLMPVGWSAFLKDYWDAQPLLVEGRPDLFSDFADVKRVRALIEDGSPWQYRRMPELYLDGTRLLHSDLVRDYVDMDGVPARSPNLARVKNLLRAGATVNTFGQESHFPKLAELRRNLGLAFSAEVEVAMFYSQKGHQGLSPHYDCVEIFVIQISGRKRWYLSSQRVDSPVVGYGKGTDFDSNLPHAQIDLSPGDLLYMPRGTFHQAVALSDESLHATVAVKPPMFMDMLQVLLKTAPDTAGIRGYLPVGGALAWNGARATMLEHLSTALGEERFVDTLTQMLTVRSSG